MELKEKKVLVTGATGFVGGRLAERLVSFLLFSPTLWYDGVTKMLHQFITGRVYIFIDVENVFYCQRTLGWKISYERLIAYLKRECGEDVKVFAYSGKDEHNTRQLKFLDMLEINGYIVRTKVVKKIKSREGSYKWKANLDIELAFEMVDTMNNYDTAVLLSGDSDFATPIDRIKHHGKRIIVASTRGHVARELLERAKFLDLRKLKDEIKQL
jgi:uncharacterized LabA/DUF88 family protein